MDKIIDIVCSKCGRQKAKQMRNDFAICLNCDNIVALGEYIDLNKIIPSETSSSKSPNEES